MTLPITATLAIALLVLPASPDQSTAFRGSADGVIVPVSVTRGGQPVSGLRREDFVIRENGVPQVLLDYSETSMPLNITMVVDTSDSMRRRPGVARAVNTALQGMRERVRPPDVLRLARLSTTISEVSSLEALWRPEAPEHRRTRLLDGLLLTVRHATDVSTRHVVVVITDAYDNASEPDDALRRAVLDRGSSTVFVVAMNQPFNISAVWPWTNKRVADVAQRTGGRLFAVSTSDEIVPMVERALQTIRATYVLRYLTSPTATPGWHAIDVALRAPQGYDIAARRGYFRE